jgi:hypothetical protein
MAFQRLYHLVLRQELHGQLVQNGYWFTSRPAFDGTSDLGVAENLRNAFQNDVLPVIRLFANNQLKFQGIVCARVSPIDGPIAEVLLETSNGAQPNDSLPSYCSGLLSLRTGLGGRSHRGRSYYAGVGEDDSSNSRLDADSLGRLQAVGNQLLTTYGPTSFSMGSYCVFSYGKRLIDASATVWNTDIACTPITQCVARPTIASQRHRQIGHGP